MDRTLPLRTGAGTEELAGAGAAARGTAAGPLVSVIVPTLDEERVLSSLLDHLAGLAGHFEFVVADGGSTDATVACARAHALAPRVVEATGGRARQLNVAAKSARGDLLVFLHDDSRLPAGAYSSLASAWSDQAVVGGTSLFGSRATTSSRGP